MFLVSEVPLYLLLITYKSSNIVETLETLRLLAKLVYQVAILGATLWDHRRT